MRVVFVGVGEAFDERLVNNCHLIECETKLLLDCGYSIPQHFWRHFPDKDYLDALYLSHRHADHYFGVPMLLLRMAEERRSRPLAIICQRGMARSVRAVIEHAYRGLMRRLGFRLDFIEATAESKIKFNELELSFAESEHPITNYSVRVEAAGRAVCYSGDGMYTEATAMLYRGADLLIHEAYAMERTSRAHAGVKEVVAMAEKMGVKCLALTHLSREFRRSVTRESLERLGRGNMKILLPEPMEQLLL